MAKPQSPLSRARHYAESSIAQYKAGRDLLFLITDYPQYFFFPYERHKVTSQLGTDLVCQLTYACQNIGAGSVKVIKAPITYAKDTVVIAKQLAVLNSQFLFDFFSSLALYEGAILHFSIPLSIAGLTEFIHVGKPEPYSATVAEAFSKSSRHHLARETTESYTKTNAKNYVVPFDLLDNLIRHHQTTLAWGNNNLPSSLNAVWQMMFLTLTLAEVLCVKALRGGLASATFTAKNIAKNTASKTSLLCDGVYDFSKGVFQIPATPITYIGLAMKIIATHLHHIEPTSAYQISEDGCPQSLEKSYLTTAWTNDYSTPAKIKNTTDAFERRAVHETLISPVRVDPAKTPSLHGYKANAQRHKTSDPMLEEEILEHEADEDLLDDWRQPRHVRLGDARDSLNHVDITNADADRTVDNAEEDSHPPISRKLNFDV